MKRLFLGRYRFVSRTIPLHVHKWNTTRLPSNENGFVTSAVPEGWVLARVYDLMTENGRGWDFAAISEVFNAQVSDLIHRISLPDIPQEDSVYWIYDKSGTFLVKSCYRALQGELSSKIPGVWKRIWALKAPPKIRNLMWRIAADYLPKATRLIRRKVDSSPICQRCYCAEEATFHVFFECAIAQATWRISQL